MTARPNLYCTVRALPDPPRPPQHARTREDPDLLPHLEGLAGFVTKASGEFTPRVFRIVQAARHVQHHLVIDAWDDAWRDFAAESLALVFLPDTTLRDERGRILVNGPVDPDAEAPIAADAREMLDAARRELLGQGLELPAGLSPGLGARQAVCRSAGDAARRALGLLTVAARADTLHAGDAMPRHELEEWFELVELTPEETRFMQSTEPSGHRGLPVDEANAAMSWRYEAAASLLWALGRFDPAPWPTSQVDVRELITTARDIGAGALVEDAALRPVDALLREQARARSANWAAREGRGGFDRGVAEERHHALNWLTGQWSPGWDETSTPT